MASDLTSKQVVQGFNEALGRYFRDGDESFVAFIDPECRIDMPGMPPNLEGLLQALPMFRAALGNFEYELSELVADGEMVAYRLRWTATHSGDFMGIPATGKQLSVTETHFDRVRNGTLVEHSGDWDQLGLLQQVGAVPVAP